MTLTTNSKRVNFRKIGALKKKVNKLNREHHERVTPRINATLELNKKERREQRKSIKKQQKKQAKRDSKGQVMQEEEEQ